MDKKEMKMEAQKQGVQKQEKIEGKTERKALLQDSKDSNLGRKGLEVGKGFRTRFWEGLFGGKYGESALKSEINPKISPKTSQEKNYGSHTAPRRDTINKINKDINKNMSNMSKNINKNEMGRTRIWEGDGVRGYLIFCTFVLFVILSLILISSQTNETNLSNENNESATEKESVGELGVELNELSALEDELDNLTSSLSSQGYDVIGNYVDVGNGGIL